jgi:hypothetical protein
MLHSYYMVITVDTQEPFLYVHFPKKQHLIRGIGIVTIDMCPNEEIAAVGLPGPYIAKSDPKCPQGTFPLSVIMLLFEHPDYSIFDLLIFFKIMTANKDCL